MSGKCAGCLEPIVKGEDFRLAGPEAFHAECLHLISQSVGTKRQLALVEANRLLVCERERLRQVERQLEETQIDCNSKNQRIRQLEAEKRTHDERRAAQQNAEIALLRSQRDIAIQGRTAANDALARAQTDLAALRKQVEELTAAREAEVKADKEMTDDYTGIKTRFGLLEMD